MKIPTDAPVKIVMLGAGGTGGHMLSLLTLSAEHRENLRERGLSDDRIDLRKGNRFLFSRKSCAKS